MVEKDKTIESNTNLRIHIMWGGDYTDISSFVINWKLTNDQQPLYPLFYFLQQKNHLNIYDNFIGGYLNNKIIIKNYNKQLKAAFNKRYPGSNNYQYTNFTTSLANQTLNTNDESNKLGLVISNGQSHYIDNNFVINFYNIQQIFNRLNNIYIKGSEDSVWGSWPTRTSYYYFLRILDEDDLYNCPLIHYEKYLTFQGYLPGRPKKGEFPEVNTITIWYKKEFMAKVRAMYN